LLLTRVFSQMYFIGIILQSCTSCVDVNNFRSGDKAEERCSGDIKTVATRRSKAISFVEPT
jgi:hypothetical protein